jgi:hypothetical protein
VRSTAWALLAALSAHLARAVTADAYFCALAYNPTAAFALYCLCSSFPGKALDVAGAHFGKKTDKKGKKKWDPPIGLLLWVGREEQPGALFLSLPLQSIVAVRLCLLACNGNSGVLTMLALWLLGHVLYRAYGGFFLPAVSLWYLSVGAREAQSPLMLVGLLGLYASCILGFLELNPNALKKASSLVVLITILAVATMLGGMAMDSAGLAFATTGRDDSMQHHHFDYFLYDPAFERGVGEVVYRRAKAALFGE